MWVSGVVRRKRHVALAEMVALAGRTGAYEKPWRLTPHIWDHFASEAAILEELQRDWRTALAGEVYVTIEAGEGDLQADVMKAFCAVQRRQGHARRILEAHADHPAIAGAMKKEKALLASFSGLLADAGAGAAA
jgi:hypothetical protein